MRWSLLLHTIDQVQELVQKAVYRFGPRDDVEPSSLSAYLRQHKVRVGLRSGWKLESPAESPLSGGKTSLSPFFPSSVQAKEDLTFLLRDGVRPVPTKTDSTKRVREI